MQTKLENKRPFSAKLAGNNDTPLEIPICKRREKAMLSYADMLYAYPLYKLCVKMYEEIEKVS